MAWSDQGSGRLRARFPATLPAHGPVQGFAFDPDTGLLTRHHSTAEVIGGWARAAQRVSKHRDFDGIPVPTRRRVTPRGVFGKALPGPLLIGIAVHEFALHVT